MTAAVGGGDAAARPAMLIALPHGLAISGVATWAVRLAGCLVARGHQVALVIHPERQGDPRLDLTINPRIHTVQLSDVPPIDACHGDLSPFLPHYRHALDLIRASPAAPAILSPNLHGDSYGIAAALATDPTDAARIRVLGWQHSDIEYDTRLLQHYSPILSRFIAVSVAIEASLHKRLSSRAADILMLPYGVPTFLGSRRTFPPRGAPLRLIYTGRLEHQQKRIMALVALSDELAHRGLAHTLTIVGDGPARAELQTAAANQRDSRLHIQGPAAPHQLAALLQQHDYFILPSRYEGLSIAMLEAMSAGCIPILARTNSGALQAVSDGLSGFIADIDPDAGAADTGLALAQSLLRALRHDPAQVSRDAQATIASRFSLDAHANAVSRLLTSIAAEPPRYWPAERPCAFSAAPGSHGPSGSVPADGPTRLASLLHTLSGRRVVIHGTGQHTLQLADIFQQSPATIVAFADDDPARRGDCLWARPILAPAEAATTGATDVVISSWMHQDAILARRDIYERQGLRVHGVY